MDANARCPRRRSLAAVVTALGATHPCNSILLLCSFSFSPHVASLFLSPYDRRVRQYWLPWPQLWLQQRQLFAIFCNIIATIICNFMQCQVKTFITENVHATI